MRENDEWIIKINYLDERECVVKRDKDNSINDTKNQWHSNATPTQHRIIVLLILC